MNDNALIFVHISDIHFHKLSGDQYDLDEDLRNELLLDVDAVTAEIGTPNGILVTGDIAFSGKPEEYVNAKAFLTELCERLGGSLADVWCVPGNHDVDQDRVQDNSILEDGRRTDHPTPLPASPLTYAANPGA